MMLAHKNKINFPQNFPAIIFRFVLIRSVRLGKFCGSKKINKNSSNEHQGWQQNWWTRREIFMSYRIYRVMLLMYLFFIFDWAHTFSWLCAVLRRKVLSNFQFKWSKRRKKIRSSKLNNVGWSDYLIGWSFGWIQGVCRGSKLILQLQFTAKCLKSHKKHISIPITHPKSIHTLSVNVPSLSVSMFVYQIC